MSERWSRQEALAEALGRGEAPPDDAGLDAEELADVAAALDALRAATADDDAAPAFGPLAGQRIGDYELLEPVGRGAFGTVYRARDLRLNVEVALKLVAAPPGVEAEVQDRFEREARAVARLDHPHVVRVRAAGWDPRGPFLVMDFVEGRSLQRRLEEGPLEVREAVALARQLCGALAHAHQAGVLHRDVKPDNVLLTADGRALLSDFGLARDALAPGGSAVSQPGHALGTPGYWPPEQARGDLDAIGPASDVYGVGATLYAALTGRPPYTGPHTLAILEAMARREPIPPPSRSNPAVDARLDAICARCLALDPADREPSAEALDAALAAWEAGGPQEPRAPARGGWVLLASVFAMVATVVAWGVAVAGLEPPTRATIAGPASPPASASPVSVLPKPPGEPDVRDDVDEWGEEPLEDDAVTEDEGADPGAGRDPVAGGPAADPPAGAAESTLELENARWQRLAVITPEVRQSALVVSDPAASRVLMFGGQIRKTYSDQLWSWDGGSWRLLATPTRPPGRAQAAGVVDGGGRLLVFGGKGPDGWLDDAWAWDGERWAPLTLPTGARRILAAAHDRAAQRTLLLCERQLWALDAGGWRELAAPPVSGRALCWVERRQAVLLLGQDGRLWEFDGEGWGGATAPLGGGFKLAQVVDAGQAGALVLLSRRPTRRDVTWETWRFVDDAWARLDAGQPGGPIPAGLGWLPERSQAVFVTGGRRRQDPGETWVLELP